MAEADKQYFCWQLDKKATAEAVINQERYEPITNSFGANDFVLEFLKKQGLWEVINNPEATLLKQGNGKDPKILNQIMTIKELIGIKRISNSGVIFSDVCSVANLGFNLEEVVGLAEQDKGVISKNTLWNHSNRIPAEESYRAWYEQVNFLRKKKLLRGGLYAIDGYEIEITVNNEKSEYEDAGRVWCADENRYKYGYKLLLLVNIAKNRERIVGVYFDRIEVNEVKIMQKMIAHIEKYVCPFSELVEHLVMDRGYWSKELLSWLHSKKIGFTTLLKDNLCLVKDDLKDLISQGRITFKKYRLKNKKYYERKTKHILKKPSKEVKYLDVELATEKDLNYQAFSEGYLNVVIRREKVSKSFRFEAENLLQGVTIEAVFSQLAADFKVKAKNTKDHFKTIDSFLRSQNFEEMIQTKLTANQTQIAKILADLTSNYQGKLSKDANNEKLSKRLEILILLYPQFLQSSPTEKKYKHIFYVTNLEIKNPLKVVENYGERNVIENKINRELDQRWFMRKLSGRNRNSMMVRIMLVLKLFNCEKILKMKHPKFHEDVKKRMQEKEDHSFLQEVDIAVYITEKDYFGIFKASEFALLVKERTKKALLLKLDANKKNFTQEEIVQLINDL